MITKRTTEGSQQHYSISCEEENNILLVRIMRSTYQFIYVDWGIVS